MVKFFAEKMWVAFAVQKLLTFFQQKISEYCVLNPLKQLTKWPLTTLWTTGPRTLDETHSSALRKQAYSNILKIYHQKMAIFQIRKSDIFHISAQNIDCGYLLELPRRGGSNEYPQSLFLSRNKKNNVYPCKPQFYYIKVGFKGVKII